MNEVISARYSAALQATVFRLGDEKVAISDEKVDDYGEAISLLGESIRVHPGLVKYEVPPGTWDSFKEALGVVV